jgi:ectoine hydroxylase
VASGTRKNIASDFGEDGKPRTHDGYRNIVELDEAFLPLLTMSTTVPLVMQLMSPRLQLHTSHLIWRHPSDAATPDVTSQRNWHRDIQRLTRDLENDVIPRVEIKIAYYLSDCSKPGCGQTLFAKGSHRLRGRLNIPEGQVDPVEKAEPLLKAGDAVLFENRTWHCGPPNFAGMRKTIMFGYSYRWMRPDDYLSQPPALLERCSDLERSLIEPKNNYDDSGEFLPGGIVSALDLWANEHGL